MFHFTLIVLAVYHTIQVQSKLNHFASTRKIMYYNVIKQILIIKHIQSIYIQE